MHVFRIVVLKFGIGETAAWQEVGMMLKRLARWGTLLGIVVLIAIAPVAAEQPSVGAEPGFIPGSRAKHQVYANTEFGFSFEGPEGWSGLTQAYDASGRPLHDLPPAVRQLFKKEYVGPPPGPVSPWMELQIGDVTTAQRSLEMLRAFTNTLPAEDLMTPPAEERLGSNVWATAEDRTSMPAQGQEVALKSKHYLLTHGNKMIFIKGTSTAAEYNQDKRLFDQAVSTAKFSDNPLLDLLKDAAQQTQ